MTLGALAGAGNVGWEWAGSAWEGGGGMKGIAERVRAWLLVRRWSEGRTAEGEVARDRHQVTGRPTAEEGRGTPGTTGTGPNGSFVGRVSGDDAGE